MKSRKRRFRQDTSQDDQTDSEKENDKLRLCLTIATDKDKEVDYEILDKKYPIIEWKTEYLGTKPQFDETKRLEGINLNVLKVSKLLIKMLKLSKIISRFDRVFGYILQEFKKSKLKKHEVKQVEQSCLGEDCWEL
ncbi:hypothetical protein Tco_0586337 [Tanacetum coccineum]